MKKNIPPEEKLLRLIRKEKKKVYRHPSLIQKYLLFFNIQKIILVAFVAASFYLFISLIYPWVRLKNIKIPKIEQEKNIEPEIEPKEEIKPFEFYQKGIENRQIFSGALGTATETPLLSGALNSDLVKDINLVGIISGENPQAIIEDKKIQKTYYVTKGQFIGELQVEDIQEGKVILNYKGQRFELYL